MVPNTAQGCVNSVPFEEEGRVCFWGHSPPQHTKHSETLLPDTLHSSWPHDFGTRDLNDLWVEQKPAESYTFPPHKCAISYLCRWSFAFHLHGFVRKSSLFGAKGGYFSLDQFSSNFFFLNRAIEMQRKKPPHTYQSLMPIFVVSCLETVRTQFTTTMYRTSCTWNQNPRNSIRRQPVIWMLLLEVWRHIHTQILRNKQPLLYDSSNPFLGPHDSHKLIVSLWTLWIFVLSS